MDGIDDLFNSDGLLAISGVFSSCALSHHRGSCRWFARPAILFGEGLVRPGAYQPKV